MALTLQTLRNARASTVAAALGLRWTHGSALPAPLDGIFGRNIASPPLVLPEVSYGIESSEIGFPSFPFGGPMELMAVPKKKVSRARKRIRNAPKALKPTPVIIRCKSCGRVKLPHFYCCSGERGTTTDEQNDGTS